MHSGGPFSDRPAGGADEMAGFVPLRAYGGNAALRGWQDIGWPGDRQPVGYPPAQVSQPAQEDVLHPKGVVAKLLRLLDPSGMDAGGR
jgi:hypothetical protein